MLSYVKLVLPLYFPEDLDFLLIDGERNSLTGEDDVFDFES
jgi:hypothetical protein